MFEGRQEERFSVGLAEKELVVVTGASGFVGRSLVPALLDSGYDVRAVSRSGSTSQARDSCQVLRGDIGDSQFLRTALAGASTLIHLVGALRGRDGRSVEDINVSLTKEVLTEAREAGVPRILFLSALGAAQGSDSRYALSKWNAERAVEGSGLSYSILRCAFIYGPSSPPLAMLQKLASNRVVPVIGNGRYRLQPVVLEDVVATVVGVVNEPGWWGRTLDVGGPFPMAYDDVVRAVARAMDRRVSLVHLPLSIGKAVAMFQELVSGSPMVTRDELRLLVRDAVVAQDNGVELVLGRPPVSFEVGLPTALGI